MPGNRLTHHDRQQIATHLAAGLGYADIARQLGRPTSTVSREVSRNGGRDGYRADHAEHATRQRARRVSGPAPHTEGEAVRTFLDSFTATMVATGLARMPARVLVCLLTSPDGSLSAADLVHRLQVSPAAVSKAVGYLEAIGLIRRERDGRRERYVMDDDVWYRALSQQVRVCQAWAASARQGAQVYAGSAAGVRLGEMGEYFDNVGRDLATAADHWRSVFTDRHR
ncbi:helix-turn-helix domain-containing protein [Fodinicola acaciae]|uniref:GbsR/MarR family transcriptional regulator n=1 Tax=Fodinicola acaciae TaxID=2681555 RepID=UPI0013D8A32F